MAVVKFFDHFPLDDDEGIVDIPSPEFWFVVCDNRGLYFLKYYLCDEAREWRSHWRPLLPARTFSEQSQLEEVGVGYTFFWSGRPKSEQRHAGVAFAIRNDIVGRLPCLPQVIDDRLMSLRLPL
ncbi:unnamed protein product [Schistocephalus solidus]|uniref:Uncharacterized protein n=1 Tax=Schistocephalus solidus TaxID=70667 RepID=A0A183TLG3_SCHSO|nr:unnamed protein product [Schistocephalus solidus]